MTPPRRTPATELAIYNPDLLRKDDLIVQFVARRALLALLLDDLRRVGASGGNQHHLLIGTRGMGKTMLLRRLRFAIEDDATLATHWFPLTFPEEQYHIVRLSDFWANCLDALSDMLDEHGREAEAAALDEAVKNLPEVETQRCCCRPGPANELGQACRQRAGAAARQRRSDPGASAQAALGTARGAVAAAAPGGAWRRASADLQHV